MILGIDLGSAYCGAAWVNTSGEARVLTTSDGARRTPASVCLPEAGAAETGTAAGHVAPIHPARLLYAAKAHMGTDKCLRVNGRDYGSADIAAMLLKHLTHSAEVSAGEPAERVVVAVPAYYNDTQCAAVLDAARLAGIPCRHLIREDAAAAAAFGPADREETLLVCDLGDSFKFSLLRRDGKNARTLAADGKNQPGGTFLDALLCDSISDCLLDEGVDLENDETLRGVYEELSQKVERAKCRLSFAEEAELTIPTPKGERSFTLLRGELEKMLLPLLHQMEGRLRRLATEAQLDLSQIDRVLLVGGASHTPLIRMHLETLLGRHVEQLEHPEDAVALGAALCARDLRYVDEFEPRAIGILCYDPAEDTERFYPIIPRGSAIPTSKHHIFCTAEDTEHIYLRLAVESDDPSEGAQVLRNCDLKLSSPVPAYTDVNVELTVKGGDILIVLIFIDEPKKLSTFCRIDRSKTQEAQENLAISVPKEETNGDGSPEEGGVTD